MRASQTIRVTPVVVLMLVAAGIGINLLTNRPHRESLPLITFEPSGLPPYLKAPTAAVHGGDEAGFVRQELRFKDARTHAAASAQGIELTIATVAYDATVIDPAMERRLSGEPYRSMGIRPVARRITIRGHEGVLEAIPPESDPTETIDGHGSNPEAVALPDATARKVKARALTWIERPGVYIQMVSVGLTEQQLVEIATTLHEQPSLS